MLDNSFEYIYLLAVMIKITVSALDGRDIIMVQVDSGVINAFPLSIKCAEGIASCR